jgi:hypothetical protein
MGIINSDEYRRGREDQLVLIRDLLKEAKRIGITHEQTVEIFEKSLDDLVDGLS